MLFLQFSDTPQMVNYYVRQLKATGSEYAELLQLSYAQLKELFPCRCASDSDRYEELVSDFSYYKKQLLLPGATREVLWKEYLQTHLKAMAIQTSKTIVI